MRIDAVQRSEWKGSVLVTCNPESVLAENDKAARVRAHAEQILSEMREGLDRARNDSEVALLIQTVAEAWGDDVFASMRAAHPVGPVAALTAALAILCGHPFVVSANAEIAKAENLVRAAEEDLGLAIEHHEKMNTAFDRSAP